MSRVVGGLVSLIVLFTAVPSRALFHLAVIDEVMARLGSDTTTQSNGSGLAGATVTLSGAASKTTTTDSAGWYTFTALSNGSYTITPSKSGCSFSPTSRNVTLSGSNAAGQNFTQSGGCC